MIEQNYKHNHNNNNMCTYILCIRLVWDFVQNNTLLALPCTFIYFVFCFVNFSQHC